MKNFLKKIQQGQEKPKIPEHLNNSLLNRFENPLNVEWTDDDGCFEAVFHMNDREHIARFKKTGGLINLKINLPLADVPETVHKRAEKHGELMNVIEIQSDKTVNYELIVRNDTFVRFYLLLNAEGEVLEKEKL